MSRYKVSWLAVLVVLAGALAITLEIIPRWSDPIDEPQSEPNAETIEGIDTPKEVVALTEVSRHTPARQSISDNQVSLDQSTGITIVDGQISIAVKNASLREALEIIAKQTGITFNLAREIENRQISIELRDASVEQALRSLLTGLDAFFYVGSQGSSPPSVRTVWVYPQDRGRALVPLENRTDVVEEPIQVEDNTGNSDSATTEKLTELVHDDDPAIRMQGLSALVDSSEADDANVRATLKAALADQDASVRAYAVQALGSRGGEEAMEHLWEALSDPDPSVRVMAVETVDPRGQGITLLEVAASDSDETVRSTAKFRLEHAGSEER